jgi:hypothetical protein
MTKLPNKSLEPSTLRCGHHGQRSAWLDIRWLAWLSFGRQASFTRHEKAHDYWIVSCYCHCVSIAALAAHQDI